MKGKAQQESRARGSRTERQRRRRERKRELRRGQAGSGCSVLVGNTIGGTSQSTAPNWCWWPVAKLRVAEVTWQNATLQDDQPGQLISSRSEQWFDTTTLRDEQDNDKSKRKQTVEFKYWIQRYILFSLYDQGVLLDSEGWHSVTPEPLAQHIASRLSCGVIVDAFCGVGGNTIQFARTCRFVVAIDIDPHRLNCAKRNAEIYGVADRIQFVLGDYLTLIPGLKADVVFLSPPWGGPGYLSLDRDYSLQDIVLRNGEVDGVSLFAETLRVTQNIAYFLPRNVDRRELAALSSLVTDGEGSTTIEIEENYLNGKLKTVTAYFGRVASRTTSRHCYSPLDSHQSLLWCEDG